MLLRDLKKVANDCCFNPNKPSKEDKIILDIGNPTYWTIKSIECIQQANNMSEGSDAYNRYLKQAIRLLILTEAFIDDKAKKTNKPKKTRKRTTGSDSTTTQTP